MNLDQALQTFIAEGRDLLRQMEDALLRIETDPRDADMVNALFRAAHTIKGSAGLFGLDSIVQFTHVVENVLDRVRGGNIPSAPGLIALLLACGDHIGNLIDAVAEQGTDPGADMRATEQMLLAQLHAVLGTEKNRDDGEIPLPAEHKKRVEASGGGVETDNWHISLRFGRDTLRNGMDPLSFIRYLGTLGEIISLIPLPDAIPPCGEMDPESCYLGFEIDFKSDAGKETIAAVFEFVREDSVIHILAPHSKIAQYAEMIRSLPENDARLGEILVASGALTNEELEEGLRIQCSLNATDHPDAATPPLGYLLVEQQVVQREVVDAALSKQTQVRENKSKQAQYIRVQANKLDELIILVGELVIASASASVLAQRCGEGALEEATSAISERVEAIRDSALQLRMVEIGETFNRFQRVVRDVSRELGKNIELVVSGDDTELDKTVVEKIGDPLMHLVRNSMDHGIEPSEVRLARGKPAKGMVSFNAYHDSGSIVIEVADDGSGLNRDKILQKAREKGLIAPDQNLSEQDIYRLIFEPGFSTAGQVSKLSGRGVGMDVVKRNITALRGTIDVESREGVGCTLRIRLPLTLAIIDGFLVGVDKSVFVVPLDMVVECVEFNATGRHAADDSSYINLRGEVLPFLRLRELFELPGEAGRRENVVVVRYGGQKACLVVDNLMGEFQTVIKPLGALFANIKGIGGSTILGSGEVALILDVPGLLQQAATREVRDNAAAGNIPVAEKG